MITCPACQTPVQPDWDWCYACGWDPEGLRPDGAGPSAATAATRAAPAGPPAPGRVTPRASGVPPAYGAPPAFGPPPGYGVRPGPGGPGRTGSTGSSVVRVGLLCAGALIGILVVCVLAVALLGQPSTSTSSGVSTTVTTSKPAPTSWQRWTASDGSFGVDFPGPAEHGPVEGVPAEFIATEQATASYGRTEYWAFYFELSPDYVFNEPFLALNAAVDGMGNGGEITFSSRTRGAFGLLPSLSFTGSVDGGRGTVQGITFISERRVFGLYTVAYNGELVDYDHLVASFALG